eukprot:19305-Heterococcus_DN1.PRE.3
MSVAKYRCSVLSFTLLLVPSLAAPHSRQELQPVQQTDQARASSNAAIGCYAATTALLLLHVCKSPSCSLHAASLGQKAAAAAAAAAVMSVTEVYKRSQNTARQQSTLAELINFESQRAIIDVINCCSKQT